MGAKIADPALWAGFTRWTGGKLSSPPPPPGVIAYKVLRRDRKAAPYTGFVWPVPSGLRPGRWVKLDGEPVICVRGYHGWLKLERALLEARIEDIDKADESTFVIYEMEIGGRWVADGEKVATTRARLLRVATLPVWETIGMSLMHCRTCGQAHATRQRMRQTTTDAVDGHAFAPEDWATFASRATPWEQAQEALRLRHAATKKYVNGGYYPVVPAFHGAFKPWGGEDPDLHKNECGACGLSPEFHDIEATYRDEMSDLLRPFDRWELMLMLIAAHKRHGDILPDPEAAA